MSKQFTLSDWNDIPVVVGLGVDNIDLDEKKLLKFPAFNGWQKTLRENLERQKRPGQVYSTDPWRLEKVMIHHVTLFGENIGFMTIEAFLRKGDGQALENRLDRVIFLRGGSVAVLMILRPKDNRNERYVILTDQPRLGACSTTFLEIPAGMLDEETRNIKGKAIQEIEEETNLQVRADELINLTELALRQSKAVEDLQQAIYMSPANLDEFIPLLLWEKELDRKDIMSMRSQLGGERTQGELITIRVTEYDTLWREGARDAKTLSAWALYEGLNRTGVIEKELQRIRSVNFDK
ncbi:uncharacterized protein CC84DRAFT_1162771 [Paraphaeosphaeria sporulosa]|uniref:Nudix hydrolase domain-containing protein n=1 Tax=Paraphaeosphaeria sporulosa TaxID=1460663 RepID=A0A177CQA7_9PLEO|nr:uncharacterized protein CC84DRAFT_1162771 [Paraphaeosphaeria sporulosa]OAG08959.1 hypothetical protein CC84DRAFT_1162771 [Paraphaeosphaeria sporulosa]